MFPALYLYPLNDSFVPKHISLAGGQRIKIGRQTNAKTVPAERNGFFDSKVLSRQHAEVWEEQGKVSTRSFTHSAVCGKVETALLHPHVFRPTPTSLMLFVSALHQRRKKLERHLHQRRAPQQ
jgi:hypothetical protein